jgi:hypothetical protein
MTDQRHLSPVGLCLWRVVHLCHLV